MKQNNVLVAGGAGFIGSHLCRALIEDGANVYCIDSLLTGTTQNLAQFGREPRFNFLRHDIVDPLPASIRVDRIYNLACAASPPHYQADPIHTMLTSVMGTRNLLTIAADQGARFLLASTSEIYGDPLVHPQAEDYCGNVNPTGPRACYDEGKRAAESLCFDYQRTRRIDMRVARIFNTYGPHMRADDGRVVSNFICQALAGEDVTVYGDGSQTRSFCYVSDMVEGLMRLMHVDGINDGPVNLGNPNEITVNELVRLVKGLTGSSAHIVRRPLPADDPRKRRPDISRARKLLGWQPAVSLAEGLPHTVRWFKRTSDTFQGASERMRVYAAESANGVAVL